MNDKINIQLTKEEAELVEKYIIMALDFYRRNAEPEDVSKISDLLDKVQDGLLLHKADIMEKVFSKAFK